MHRRLFNLTLIFLSVVIGWTIGYLKTPFIEGNYSFWIGFIACLTIFSFSIACYLVWQNNKANNLFNSDASLETSKQNEIIGNNNYFIIFIISLIFIGCLYVFLNNMKTKEQLLDANNLLNELKQPANLEQQRNKITLLLDLIKVLDSTNVNIKDTTEVNQLLNRIVTLSSSFSLYKEWDMENKVFQTLSSERGLLLLALVKTKMDSHFFNKIMEKVSFYGADLRNADFQGLDLSGIYLKNANLGYANLQGANLNNANLMGVNLIGANLNKASFVGANFLAAKLNWAKINQANLQMAKLDSADLSNATVQQSNLNHVSLIEAILCNTIFYESDLSSSFMSPSYLNNANFTKAVLTNAGIYDTHIGATILNDAVVHENWTAHLLKRNNSGVNTMLEKYNIVRDSISIQDSIIYRLIEK